MPQLFNSPLTKTMLSALFLIGFLLIVPSIAVSEERLVIQNEIDQKSTWEERFSERVETWIQEISEKDNRFSAWQGSTWESYPFGPGSKQWIIILKKEQIEVGYLIVGADPESEVALIEYGQMDSPVLQELTSIDSWEDHFFYNGLLWSIDHHGELQDLITGEKYTHVGKEKISPSWSGSAVSALSKVTIKKENDHDPITLYQDQRNLVEKQKKAQNELSFAEANASAYFAEIIPQVKGIYGIDSIHYWNGDESPAKNMFIGLDDSGIRFFSADYLSSLTGASLGFTTKQ